jgi:hypothetical protein
MFPSVWGVTRQSQRFELTVPESTFYARRRVLPDPTTPPSLHYRSSLRESTSGMIPSSGISAFSAPRSRCALVLVNFRKKGAAGIFCYSQDGLYVDLYDLCRRVAGCHRLPEDVRSAAKDVINAVERFMSASFGMSHYNQFEAAKNGVFLVLPSGEPNCWKGLRWYTPTRGDVMHAIEASNVA